MKNKLHRSMSHLSRKGIIAFAIGSIEAQCGTQPFIYLAVTR